MARILTPRTGDTVTITAPGPIPVQIWYSYATQSTLTCFVDTDHDAGSPFNGTGVDPASVLCSKGPGTFSSQVLAQTNGVTDDTQTITLVVSAVMSEMVVGRTGPQGPTITFQPGTGPTQYTVSDTFAAQVAYVVCVAHELDLNPAIAGVTVGGVVITNNNPTWSAVLTVPNRPNKKYTARIIEFDARDNIKRMRTIVLA
jgi:hypothetical protein